MQIHSNVSRRVALLVFMTTILAFTVYWGGQVVTASATSEVMMVSVDPIITVVEGAGTANVPISNTTGSLITVTAYATTDDTATSGLDYEAVSSTSLLTVENNTSGNISVTILPDNLDENAETLTLTLTYSDGVASTSLSTIITITDDDPSPTLTLPAASSFAEEDGQAAITVTLAVTSGRDVTFTYKTVVGSASASDYDTISETVGTISAGTTSETIALSLTDDDVYELNEAFQFVVVTATHAIVPTGGLTQQVTILDNDPAPTLSVSQTQLVSESAGEVAIMVVLSGTTELTATFDYATSDITAQAGTDYTQIVGTANITVGMTSVSLTVPIFPDTLDEPDETFAFVISNPQLATLGDAVTTTVTITDDDTAPTLSMQSATSTIGEDDTQHVVVVELDNPSSFEVTFDYATSDISATAGSDYTSASGTGSIAAGTLSTTVTIPLIDDMLDEADETFQLTLSNVNNAITGTLVHTVTITDNDEPPALSVADRNVNEGDGTVDVIVSLDKLSGLDVSFDYATADITATSSSDYQVTTGSATILAGQTAVTLTVVITNDSINENAETFSLTVTNAQNATVVDDSGEVTIIDNDSEPSLSVNDLSVNEGDGTVSVVVNLSAVSGLDVSFDYATMADGTATAGDDFTATSGNTTIPAGQQSTTISIDILPDSIDESDETFSLSLTDSTNAAINVDTSIITIVDDDPTPSLSVSDLSVDEGAGTASVVVSLNAISGLDVSFDYATMADGTATAGNDFTATSGTITIPDGEQSATITIDIVSDSIDESDETFSLQIDEPSNAIIGDGISILTILDDDALPTLSVSDETVSEDAGTVEVTISLNTESGRDVSFDYETVDNSATAGEDYTSNTGSATISAGDTSTTVSIAILNDDLGELEESFHLEISNPTLATIDNDTGVIAITPDSDRFKLYLPISAKQYHPFVNGGFETGGFGSGWSASGAMGAQVVSVIDTDGNLGQATDNGWIDGGFAALLGNPSYNNTGGVPVGFGEIRQTISLPSDASGIKLKYRIVTHDQIFAPSTNRYFDSFEVSINSVETSDGITPRRDDRCRTNPSVPATDATGLVLCDGFVPFPSLAGAPNNILRTNTIDVSVRAGQNINLILRVHNRVDGSFNTWVYVDSVEVVTEP